MLCFPCPLISPPASPAPAPPWDPFSRSMSPRTQQKGPRWLYLLYLVRSWTEPGQILWFSPSSKPSLVFLPWTMTLSEIPWLWPELPGRVLNLYLADVFLLLGLRDTEEFGFPTHSWLSPLSLQGLLQLHYSWLSTEAPKPPFNIWPQLPYCIEYFPW